jgi:prepilin-type N-terminal cleavage/methylation domain-containing protein
MRRRHLQRGFTLIELVLASAGAAAVLAGASWLMGLAR